MDIERGQIVNDPRFISAILLAYFQIHGQDLTVSTESIECLYLATQGDPFDPKHQVFAVVYQEADPHEHEHTITFYGHQN